MRKNLVIIGNSGAARECYWLARDMVDNGEDMEIKGFLSFEGYNANLCDLSDKLIGDDDAYCLKENDVLSIGIGMPGLRKKAFLKWKIRGGHFVNLIHHSVTLVHDVILGEANILCCRSYLSCNTHIGDANYLNGSVVVGHDASIGDFNFFGPFSMVLGGATLGSCNTVGVNAVVLPHAQVGDNNIIAPGAYIYKGCANKNVMMGNPAYNIGPVGSLGRV